MSAPATLRSAKLANKEDAATLSFGPCKHCSAGLKGAPAFVCRTCGSKTHVTCAQGNYTMEDLKFLKSPLSNTCANAAQTQNPILIRQERKTLRKYRYGRDRQVANR